MDKKSRDLTDQDWEDLLMPTMDFNRKYGLSDDMICKTCGLPYMRVGEGAICTCPRVNIDVRDIHKQRVNNMNVLMPGTVYAGKLGGVPLYVNSEADAIKLQQFMEDAFDFHFPLRSD